MKRESYSQRTFKAALLNISAPDADLWETCTHTKTPPAPHTHTHTSRRQTHRFAQSACLFLLSPSTFVLRQEGSGLWTPSETFFVLATACHTHARTFLRHKHLCCSQYWHIAPIYQSTQLPRTQTQTAKAKTLCVKHMHKRRADTACVHRCSRTYTHSCTQKLPSICSPTLWQEQATNRTYLHFQRRLRFCVAPSVNRQTHTHKHTHRQWQVPFL